MRKSLLSIGLALALSAGFARADDTVAKTPDQIVAEYEAVPLPQLDPAKREDKAAIDQFIKSRNAAMEHRGELALELWKTAPDHPKALPYMQARWMTQLNTGRGEQARKEIDAALAAANSDKQKVDLQYMKSMIVARDFNQTPDAVLAAAEDFIKAAPKDDRGASLLMSAADRVEAPEKSAALYRRVIAEYPNFKGIAQAKGKIRQAEGVGKPFELSFNDAISGKSVSIESLKGKVLVVDFWATWCGPCVGEMPHMKEIYSKYKGKGVEFIGVSLDNPEETGKGLTKLKEFVAKNEIGWPQYYQGKGWQSEFSSSWGINAIPCVFVVDQKGNLYSTDARGHVEELIDKLLTGTASTNG